MADIYKMDTDYLSAESVYDRTLGKKQSEINNTLKVEPVTGMSSANCTVGDSVAYKMGKLVIISMQLTANSNIAAYANILSSLPQTSNTVNVIAMKAGSTSEYYPLYITARNLVTRNAISSGSIFRFVAVYFAI